MTKPRVPADATDGSHIIESAEEFIERLQSALPLLVLTGAGISAGTGIPTYRDADGRWLRSDPIKHQEFVSIPRMRQRYWGRSLRGWPGVRDALPAVAHRALTTLEDRGHLTHIVTQNVDRLHQRAGSQHVTDLHGRLDRVRCLDCGAISCREELQGRLERMNPHIAAISVEARPDGDADLSDEVVASVRVPQCGICTGTLMPDVVFFGGNVPGERIQTSRVALKQAGGLLVVGSSLQVYSGYRFCRWAAENQQPVFLLNPGRTRADNLAMRWPSTADAGLTLLKQALQ